MLVALAQIDMQLGDIEGICARIANQAELAHEQGARVLCTPAPLFSGVLPGAMIDNANYEHDLIAGLEGLAAVFAHLNMVGLVPAVVSCEGAPLFEVFMLKEGRVIPVRSLLARRRQVSDELWAPPIFDIDGTRIAVSFDVLRDIELLPAGCDLIIFFQANAFDITNEASCAVAAVADGYFTREVAAKSVWLACMAPVGAFDEAVFTGGSFFMDDCRRVVSAAPRIEAALIVQDIRRGEAMPVHELPPRPQFQREAWLWEALRLYVRDAAAARGEARAVLALSGDLPSSLAAALCVDALGPRRVFGLFVERERVFTPAQEEAERTRAELVRALCRNLGIRLIERAATDPVRWMERDVAAADAARLEVRLEGVYLDDAARELGAIAVSSLTKTDAALAAPCLTGGFTGQIAPFGDVYLTEIEFLARMRCRAGAALPASLVTLNAVEHRMQDVIAASVACVRAEEGYGERIAKVLLELEPSQIDGVLEAHVDHEAAFEDIPLAATNPEAVALIVMLARHSEADRRMLPPAPMVSGGSFMERAWPAMLAWSDLGRHGAERKTCSVLVQAELERFAAEGAEHSALVRNEVLGLIGNLLGITPEQMDELRSEEGQRRLRENLEHFENQVQEAIGGMLEAGAAGGAAADEHRHPGSSHHGFPFFSPN